jgi:sulfatase modifying factor 1
MLAVARFALLVVSCVLWAPRVGAESVPTREVQQLSISLPERVRIEAGWFTLGSDAAAIAQAMRVCNEAPGESACSAESFADERPAHRVHLRAFEIDRFEVSNAQYARCVSAGVCLPSASSEDDRDTARPELPVTQVRWQDARDYCRFAGGDLPSEAQWEYAAHGSSTRAFPWGEAWNTRLANHVESAHAASQDGFPFAAPVQSFPDGKSFFGLRNMAGNVWEYMLDRYAGAYASADDQIDPQGPAQGDQHVIRGGSWRSAALALRARFRGHLPDQETRPDVGMRCVYEVQRRP